MTKLDYPSLAPEYADLWASMEVRPSKVPDINTTAHKVVAGKQRYQLVETATTVPWYVIGIIHQMECGGNWNQHLHNGDPLIHRTTHVPKGRPMAPPDNGTCYTWEESAHDAIVFDGLDKIDAWPIERILYQLERYNGVGYLRFHPEVGSPYIWSGTNHYSRGKYVQDGQWDPFAISGQSGAAPILQRVMALDADVSLHCKLSTQTTVAGPTDIETKVADPADEFRKADPEISVAQTGMASKTVIIGVGAAFSKIGEFFANTFNLLPEVNTTAQGLLDPIQTFGGLIKQNLDFLTTAVVVAAVIAVVYRHTRDKRELIARRGN